MGAVARLRAAGLPGKRRGHRPRWPAGHDEGRRVRRHHPAELEEVFDCSKAALRQMMTQRYGRIVNMTSMAVWWASRARRTIRGQGRHHRLHEGDSEGIWQPEHRRERGGAGSHPTVLTRGLPQEVKDGLVRLTAFGRIGTPEEVPTRSPSSYPTRASSSPARFSVWMSGLTFVHRDAVPTDLAVLPSPRVSPSPSRSLPTCRVPAPKVQGRDAFARPRRPGRSWHGSRRVTTRRS